MKTTARKRVNAANAKVREKEYEEYSLRPFTKEELYARVAESEAEIAAGIGTPHEEVMREWEEELAREEQAARMK